MDTFSVFVLISFLLFAAGAIVYFHYKSKAEKQRQEKEQKEMEVFTKEVNTVAEKYLANGVPALKSDIPLKKGEYLHVKLRGVDWMEYRKVRTGRVSGHGITGRIRIAKGISYRYGTGQFKSESMDLLQVIDTGDVYITNKNVIFRGGFGNKTIPFNKILKLSPSAVGVKIEKATGKDVYIPYDFKPLPRFTAALYLLWESYEQFGTAEDVTRLS